MKPRLNIYIDYELHKKLEQAAPQLGGSKSGVVEAALISFFSPDGGDRREAAIVRRLDRLSRQFDRLYRNQTIAIEALALFIRHQLSMTATLPASERAAALAKGQERFAQFIEQLGQEVATGKNLILDVVEQISPTAEDFFGPEEVEAARD